MQLGGLQKMTLIDFPQKVAATVFTSGCNFRCPFCHNPELVEPNQRNKLSLISEEYFFNFLKKRKKLLEGICITGGEPTLFKDLPNFISKIKKMGFLVKLDSNGTNPEMLQRLYKANLIDYLAMDIKSSLKKYSQAAGVKVDLEKIQESVEIIKASNKAYEFRTTVVPKLVTEKDIDQIGQWLAGTKLYVLQQFRTDKNLDSKYSQLRPYSDLKLSQFQEIAKKYFQKVELRGL